MGRYIMSECSVLGCMKTVHAKGMCNIHYTRIKRHGKTDNPIKLTDDERFMSFVEIDNKTGAWIWKGGVTSAGYGGFWLNGKTISAHRYAWIMLKGSIPAGMFICHKYEEYGRDNVNPDHLFLGTATDNMQDASKKRRMPIGSRNNQTRLTEEKVSIIRSSTETGKAMGLRFNVSQSTISKIRRGTEWRHTDDAPEKPVTIHSLKNKSGYRGVRWKRNAWEAHIVITFPGIKKTIYLGRFSDPIDAAKAFDQGAIKYRGKSAKLNFPNN